MAKKKNKTHSRNARLAVTPRAVVQESKKAEAVNNGLDPYDKSLDRGRDSYSYKAQQAGDYRKVGAVIKKYREEHPDSSYVEVWGVLHDRFPWIFEKTKEEVYSGNVAKMINNDNLWRNCYFVNKNELITLAEIRIAEILDRDDVDDKVVISAYDKLKKYELIEKELNQSNNNVITISGETLETINEIRQGLSELKAGDSDE